MKVLISVSMIEQLLTECSNPEVKLTALKEFDGAINSSIREELYKAKQSADAFNKFCEEERIKCQRD